MVNCKTFTCRRSLNVAIYRGTMNPPENLGIFLLGRKRKRGRRPQAAPAWERMGYNINSLVAHPQQDPAELAGGGENLIAEIQGEIQEFLINYSFSSEINKKKSLGPTRSNDEIVIRHITIAE
jgi:hypothetical protein